MTQEACCVCGAKLGAAVNIPDGELQVCECGVEHITVAVRPRRTIPGVTRLSDLERRLQAVEERLEILLRFTDPTSVQLSREDRDRLVAYARESRDVGTSRRADSSG